MSGSTLKVEGWAELSRDFKRIGKDASRELRDAVKPAGILIRDQARSNAQAQGLRKTGTLIRRITVKVNRAGVVVAAAAVNRNDSTRFNYPRRWEYSGRPFLTPAFDANQERAIEMVEEGLDDLFRKYGFK